ncbi:hypothetical protein ACVME8_006559 [Bradyrhizobium diazoefficiens]
MSQSPCRHTGAAAAAVEIVRIGLEIAGAVTHAVLVVPEVERHRRHRLGADELADLVRDGAALFAEGFDGGAEQATLHRAGRLWQFAVAADEGAGEIGAAGNVRPPDVGLRLAAIGLRQCGEAVVEPGLRVGAERRSGRAEAAQPRQIARGGKIDFGLGAVGEERRARAEEGRFRLRHEAPQRGPVRLVLGAAGAAVEDAAGGAAEQAADLRIPHDPAGRRVPVIALAERVLVIGAADVVVQAEQRQHHDDDAAMAVHDRLGQAGGAAGIDDPERMIERQPGRLERVNRGACPGDNIGEQGIRRGRRTGLAVQDDMRDRGQRSPQFGDDVAPIVPPAGIGDGVAGDQHFGFDLLEAVDHGGRGHVGRADAPDRANAGGREERDMVSGMLGR